PRSPTPEDSTPLGHPVARPALTDTYQIFNCFARRGKTYVRGKSTWGRRLCWSSDGCSKAEDNTYVMAAFLKSLSRLGSEGIQYT
ncbi:MAG: hypothetical protein ACTSUS_00365, partial [Candidatus Freyarchaeota archaeon]